MALSRIARVSGSASAGDSVCTAGSALTIQAGDIIVLGCGYSPNGLSISIVDTDGSTNALTALAEVSGNGNIARGAYRLSCAADASGTLRVTLGSDTYSDWGFVAWQYRPDPGDTIALAAGPAGGSSTWSAAAQTANISIDSTDGLALVAINNGQGRTYSGLQIADGACDDSYQVANLIVGVRAFTAAQSSIHGQATLSSEGAWAATILAITSTGSSEPPFPPHYRRRDNPLLRR